MTDDTQTKYPVPAFEDLTLMVFGVPGSGKTWFCGRKQDVCVAATEPGSNFIHAKRVEKIREWQDFKVLIHSLNDEKKAGKLNYDALVVDIVDNLSVMCRDSVCQAKGLTYPSEKDFGKTWAECNREWTKWLRATMDIINVRFITHCTTVDVEVPLETGMRQEVTRYIPTFSGNKAAQYLDGVVNCMGFITQTIDGRHVITFKQLPTVACKDRTDILSQLGELPSDWTTVSQAYRQKAEELGFNVLPKRS